MKKVILALALMSSGAMAKNMYSIGIHAGISQMSPKVEIDHKLTGSEVKQIQDMLVAPLDAIDPTDGVETNIPLGQKIFNFNAVKGKSGQFGGIYGARLGYLCIPQSSKIGFGMQATFSGMNTKSEATVPVILNSENNSHLAFQLDPDNVNFVKLDSPRSSTLQSQKIQFKSKFGFTVGPVVAVMSGDTMFTLGVHYGADRTQMKTVQDLTEFTTFKTAKKTVWTNGVLISFGINMPITETVRMGAEVKYGLPTKTSFKLKKDHQLVAAGGTAGLNAVIPDPATPAQAQALATAPFTVPANFTKIKAKFSKFSVMATLDFVLSR